MQAEYVPFLIVSTDELEVLLARRMGSSSHSLANRLRFAIPA